MCDRTAADDTIEEIGKSREAAATDQDRRSRTAAYGASEHRGQFGDRRVGGLSDRAIHGL